jgi:hypothetical protein
MSMALTHKFPKYGARLLLFELYLTWPWRIVRWICGIPQCDKSVMLRSTGTIFVSTSVF